MLERRPTPARLPRPAGIHPRPRFQVPARCCSGPKKSSRPAETPPLQRRQFLPPPWFEIDLSWDSPQHSSINPRCLRQVCPQLEIAGLLVRTLSQREAGTVCSTTRVLRLTSECVACKMNHVPAAVFIPVPIIDTRFAMKINLSPRCRSNSRMVLLDRVIDLPTTRLTGVLLGKRWRAPARHLSGPSGSELEARPLTSPEAYRHGCDE